MNVMSRDRNKKKIAAGAGVIAGAAALAGGAHLASKGKGSGKAKFSGSSFNGGKLDGYTGLGKRRNRKRRK